MDKAKGGLHLTREKNISKRVPDLEATVPIIVSVTPDLCDLFSGLEMLGY